MNSGISSLQLNYGTHYKFSLDIILLNSITFYQVIKTGSGNIDQWAEQNHGEYFGTINAEILSGTKVIETVCRSYLKKFIDKY